MTCMQNVKSVFILYLQGLFFLTDWFLTINVKNYKSLEFEDKLFLQLAHEARSQLVSYGTFEKNIIAPNTPNLRGFVEKNLKPRLLIFCLVFFYISYCEMLHELVINKQGMTPIAKIEIAIPISIWKIICDSIAIVDSRSCDLFCDLLKVMQKCNWKTWLQTFTKNFLGISFYDFFS